mmetsp:Transcript_28009/g.96837  ORF Transcript_28009/g.96837 Transcript_28009/m.96837 type:complete len:437 (-) Transcript_28009:64-1374(-)
MVWHLVLAESPEEFVSREVTALLYFALFVYTVQGLLAQSADRVRRGRVLPLPSFFYLVATTASLRCLYFGVPPSLFVDNWNYEPSDYVPESAQWWVNFVEFVLMSVPDVCVLAQFGIITRIWAAVSRDVSLGGRVASKPLLLFRLAIGSYASLKLFLFVLYFFDDFLTVLSYHSVISMAFSLLAAGAFVVSWLQLDAVLNPRRRHERLDYASDDSDGVAKAYGVRRDRGESKRGGRTLLREDSATLDEGAGILAFRHDGATQLARTYDTDLGTHDAAAVGSDLPSAPAGLEFDRREQDGSGARHLILGPEASADETDGSGSDRGPIGLVDGDRGMASGEAFADVRRVHRAQRRAARDTISLRIAAVAVTCAFCFVFRAGCEILELVLSNSDDGAAFSGIEQWWWIVITFYYVGAEIVPSFVVLVVLRHGGSALVRG